MYVEGTNSDCVYTVPAARVRNCVPLLPEVQASFTSTRCLALIVNSTVFAGVVIVYSVLASSSVVLDTRGFCLEPVLVWGKPPDPAGTNELNHHPPACTIRASAPAASDTAYTWEPEATSIAIASRGASGYPTLAAAFAADSPT